MSFHGVAEFVENLPKQPLQLLFLIPAGTVVWLLYHLSFGFYNLFFHPLAGYPGPVISRASTLWYSRALGRGTIAQDLLALHEKYGDTVRISPDEISFIDPKNWKEIYGYRMGPKGKVEMIKDPRYHDTVKPTVTILTGNDAQHTYYRKVLSPPFSEISLKKNEPILHQFVDKFIARIKEEGQDGTKPINATDWFNFLTFDIIGSLAYGENFNCMTDSKLHDWIEYSLAIATLMTLGQAARQLPYPFDKLYKRWAIPESVRRHTQTHRELVDQKVNTRLGTNPEHMDFLQHMVEMYKSEKLSFGTLSEHASLLTIGGSETTATLLVGAVYFLALDTGVYGKLTQEIRTRFSSEQDMNLTALSQDCPYLLSVVEEALRMYPPSPANHTRMVPEGGARLEGRHIPEGFCVCMPMYASFNASSNWVEPRRFAPERWRAGDGKYARDRKEALKPFSYGPRNCLGQQLANHEIRLVLAKIAWHFDLELMRDCVGWENQKSYTFWEKPPLWVKMIPVRS